MSALRYLRAAFNARPFGMPVPPNWLALAAVGMLGWALSPGFLLVGLGLEVAYLAWLASHPRFRATVDAALPPAEDPAERDYQARLGQLAVPARRKQERLETRAAEIVRTLGRSPVIATHVDSVEQLVWLHLQLLGARQTIARVVETARSDRDTLRQQQSQIRERLEREDASAELRRSLEQQLQVIEARQAAHGDATRRLEHVESELERIDQQVALIHEQALLATDEERIGTSLDALAASYNEASRWLSSQRDLLGALDAFDTPRLPRRVLHGGDRPHAMREGTDA